eukprot:202697_1
MGASESTTLEDAGLAVIDACKTKIKLRNADPNYKQKLLVHGFIRTYYDIYPFIIDYFPIDLMNLCYFFYFIETFTDKWDKTISHSTFNISSNDTFIETLTPVYWRNAFGERIITKGMLAKWNFKVLTNPFSYKYSHGHRQNGYYQGKIVIGLIDATQVNRAVDTSPEELATKKIAYGYKGNVNLMTGYTGNMKPSRYGRPWKDGDKITMIVDMRGVENKYKGILKFENNHEPQGIAHYLSLDKDYKMMICCFDSGEKIKMSF